MVSATTTRTARLADPATTLPLPDEGRGHDDHAAEWAWRSACEELGLELVRQRRRSFLRSNATGFIGGHEVSISLAADARHRHSVRTVYSVRFDAVHAPPFSITNRTSGESLTAGTNDPDFDQKVNIVSDAAEGLKGILTEPRRARILDTLALSSRVTITNHFARLWTDGVEADLETLVVTTRRLVEAAAALQQTWHVARLKDDEVLRDLFSSGRGTSHASERFDRFYKGRSVSWRGEVLQVGAVDRVGRRVAVLLGSVDGRNSSSGRIVALAVLDPELHVAKGDNVPVTGDLLHLEAGKRLFRIE